MTQQSISSTIWPTTYENGGDYFTAVSDPRFARVFLQPTKAKFHLTLIANRFTEVRVGCLR